MSALLSTVSWFSLRRGIHSPAVLCRVAKNLGYTAVALTDRDNLYGLPCFLDACRDNDLRPIIGAEVTQGNVSVLLYARGDKGYANLCRVLTKRHCDERFSLVHVLREHAAGLVAVTAERSLLEEFNEYGEIWYRMIRPRRPPAWVRERAIPCLVVPVAVFISPYDYDTHCLLRAIDRGTTPSRLEPAETFPADARLRSWTEIRERFEVFDRAIEATQRLGESIHSRSDFSTPILPRYPTNEPALERLRRKAFVGARRRYGGLPERVAARLDYELDIIGRKGFAPYFLVVDDIVGRSPRTCGRGSGAASIVAYSLGITNVEPLRYNLMFERFINPGRIDPPVLDIVFALDERDEVIEYVVK
ncbi:MAG: PHP domain-containing protein, partial [Chitinivibrionales bacterium]|nr:PHP domain-containing protein [Chitinivibrionales bacterium]MBD3356044.1 PHP domain-containing protein [Chitinivibrionales bacterium]